MAAPELLAAAVPAGIAAGACFAVSTVLQQHVARAAPARHSLRPQLLLDVARRPIWWLGIAAGVGSFALQAIALALGPIALVQPLIVTDLLFALPLAARLHGRRLTRRVWTSAALIVAGLALFLLSASPSSGIDEPKAEAWLPVFVAVAAVVTVSLAAAGRRRGIRRTTLVATAAAVMFGLQSALIKSVSELFANRGLDAVLAWQPWAMAGVAVSALILSQSAYQGGPVLDVFEPIVAIGIAVTAFQEHVSTSAQTLGLLSLGAAAVILGIVRLDRSRFVSQTQTILQLQTTGAADAGDRDVAPRLACRD
jgi:drug/metabolite transporter (DMT)-like permease